MVISAEAVLEAALTAPETLPATLEAAGALPPDVAVEVARRGFTALDANDLPRAQAAFSAAALMFSTLEDWPRATECGIHHAEICKVLAITEAEHSLARDRALAMQGLARRLRLPALVLGASVVVADSAYFAAQAAEENNDQDAYRRWLLVTLDDCVAALTMMEIDPEGSRARNLVSLVGATVGEVTQTHWFGEEQSHVDDALRRVALATEAHVRPGAHTFSTKGADPIALELTLARLSYDKGSPDAARTRLQFVTQSAEAQGDLPSFVRAMSALYAGEREAYRRSDDLTAVRQSFVGAVDSFRSAKRSRAGRLWMAQQLDELSGEMVSDEFARLVGRDADRAYRAVERLRARTLLDEMTGHLKELPEPVREQAAELEAAVLHLDAPPTLSSDVGDQIRLISRLPIGGLQRSPERLASLDQLEGLHTSHDAGFLGTQPLGGLDSVMEALAPDEVILSYSIPYDALDPAGTLLILAITSRGALPVHLPIHSSRTEGNFVGRIQVDGQQPMDGSALGELILNTRMSILEGEDEDAAARLGELYRILIGSVEDSGVPIRSMRTLYVVPHGILHAVPFAALRTPDGRFLAEEVATVVVPSVSIWEVLRQGAAGRPTSFLGLANPTLEDYEPLPDTEQELADVAAILTGLDTVVLVGADANESALRRLAPGRGIVHLATHGEFPESDVMNLHRVLLSPTDDNDGYVNAAELRGLDLHAAQLVVLSICDGGVYRFGPGDEPYGLLPALLCAGVANVLAPQWVIDDTEARLLVTEFYRHLVADGPAEALQSAAISRMRAGAQIRDWAGFTLFGAGSWITS